MSLYRYIANSRPNLRKELRMAKINDSPYDYVKKAVTLGGLFFVASFVLFFIFFSRDENTFFLPFVLALVVGFLMFNLTMKRSVVAINKRGKLIDRDVLFAGRLILIKLNSGAPLISALEEVSFGFGQTSIYFQDMLRNVQLGKPLEEALEEATEYCPSPSLRKVLFQITNALKVGIDVTDFLDAVIDEIAEAQLQEIVRYGKKLSSLTMVYMLVAIVVPSLGMTMFIVLASMISLDISMGLFLVIVLFLAIIQFVFITLFRAARPNIDI